MLSINNIVYPSVGGERSRHARGADRPSWTSYATGSRACLEESARRMPSPGRHRKTERPPDFAQDPDPGQQLSGPPPNLMQIVEQAFRLSNPRSRQCRRTALRCLNTCRGRGRSFSSRQPPWDGALRLRSCRSRGADQRELRARGPNRHCILLIRKHGYFLTLQEIWVRYPNPVKPEPHVQIVPNRKSAPRVAHTLDRSWRVGISPPSGAI
jgi:hypothetical protein